MSTLTSILGWGSPIGLGFFILAMAITIFYFAKTIYKLSKIDKMQHPEKYKK